ncbi:MAG: hypothetical protein U0R17_01410 [Acidimicrobiia bacterium]
MAATEDFEDEDFISFVELEDIFPDVTKEQWKELAAGVGNYPVMRRIYDSEYNRDAKRLWGFVNLDLDALQDTYFALRDFKVQTQQKQQSIKNSFELYGAIPVDKIIREYRIGKIKLFRHFELLGIEPDDYVFGNNHEGKGLNKEQYSVIRPILHRHKKMLPPKNVKSTKKIAEQLGTSETTIRTRANELGITPRLYLFHGNIGYGLTNKQIKTILEANPEIASRKNIPAAAATDMSISRVARKAGIDLPILRKLIIGAQIIPELHKFPNGRTGPSLTKQQRSALYLAYMPFIDLFNNPNEKIQYISEWAKEFSMHSDTLRKLINGTSVIPLRIETDEKIFELLTQSQIDMIDKIYEPFRKDQPISLGVYAKQNKTQVSVIVELARAAGINPQYYLFRNKTALGLLPSEIALLEETYKPFLDPEDPLDAITTLQTYAQERNVSVARIKTKLKNAGIEPVMRPNPNGARRALSITGREQLQLETTFPELALTR